jgi:hypothetical protein
MINEIRSYFKSVITEVDSDLKQHSRYFISNDIADTRLEDTYHLFIGNMTTNRQDTDMIGTVNVGLKFWKNGNNDEINRIDTAYCNAIEMQLKLMDQTRLSQNDFMKSVVGINIEVRPDESNDNLAEFELQFIITVGYKSY